MAERIGRVCDDCMDEVVGTCAAPLLEMSVGLYEGGDIPGSARLPRLGWDIFLHYDEETDKLVQNPLPRAELCAGCWEMRFAIPDATQIRTLEEYLIAERVARGIPPEGRPVPEPPKQPTATEAERAAQQSREAARLIRIDLGLALDATDRDVEARKVGLPSSATDEEIEARKAERTLPEGDVT